MSTLALQTVSRAVLLVLLTLIASTAMAQSIDGTAYRERMALPPVALFEALLEDVSRADAPAETIARTRLTSPGNPPIAFTSAYEPSKIVAGHRPTQEPKREAHLQFQGGRVSGSGDRPDPIGCRGDATGGVCCG